MKTNEVKILLQKYYDGLSSAQEESALEEYFLSGSTEPEFEADRLHFMALSSMRDEDIPVPEDLEASVLMTLNEVQKAPARLKRRTLYIVFSAAAILLLMVSTFIFQSHQDQTQYVNDPKIAYAESREALEMVSRLLNEGTSRLSSLNKINQAMEPLNQLNTLDLATRSLMNLGKE